MLTIDFDLLGAKPGEKILDAGCGAGRHSYEGWARNCTMYALDMGLNNLVETRTLLKYMDENVEDRPWTALQADALNLPFDDKSFDRVVCSEVMEHVSDDKRAMSELVRVLKDGGHLAISVPTRIPEAVFWKMSKDYRNDPGGHVRIYKTGDIPAMMQAHGLKVYASRRKHAIHTPYWFLKCLFGLKKENALIPRLYHKFLVWDIEAKTAPIRLTDDFLNHFMAKSIVFYARKDSK